MFLLDYETVVGCTACLVNSLLLGMRALSNSPFNAGVQYGLLDGVNEGFTV